MDSVSDGKPTDWKEAQRLRAWELAQQGWKQQDVAAALGVTGGAVSQWVSKAREGGPFRFASPQATRRAVQVAR